MRVSDSPKQRGRPVRRSTQTAVIVAVVALLSSLAGGLTACAEDGTQGDTTTLTTLAPPATDMPDGPSEGTTTVPIGDPDPTVPESQTRALTFIGPASTAIVQALRQIVMDSGSDGQEVLDDVARLAAGPHAEVPFSELDGLGGFGFAAGADTSQPIAVATAGDGGDLVVFAFSITGDPDATTIVGFERGTGRVLLVEGPLPISDSTGNVTTVP